MTESPREQLWQKVGPGGEGIAPHNEGMDPQPTRADTPWPGTLWVHPATAPFAVEWLVVRRGPSRPVGRFLLVPADTDPLLGLYDVEIPAGEPGGPLCVRCALARWVPPDLFSGARASGRISSRELERVQGQVDRAGPSEPKDAELGPDGGPSPDYEDRVEELRQAWAALLRFSASDPTSSSSEVGFLNLMPPLGPLGRRRVWAVLAITLGVGAVFYHGHAKLPSDPGSFFGSGSTLAGLGEDSPRNFARLVLTTAVTRGSGPVHQLVLPLEAEYALIYIILDNEARRTDYRLFLRDTEDGRELWRAEGLKVVEDGGGPALSVALSVARLRPEQAYALEVEARGENGWAPFLSRRIRVLEAEPTPSLRHPPLPNP